MLQVAVIYHQSELCADFPDICVTTSLQENADHTSCIFDLSKWRTPTLINVLNKTICSALMSL